ncbi:MAG: DUF4160 domain-containing protein [bacterium]|nr:DUF4160 domain-containing protein [bacterium]
MPVICRFFGIVIYMYWRDHMPAHFHAKYQDHEIAVEVDTGAVTGHMGKKAIALIQEWRESHMLELQQNWELASLKKELHHIEPLE